MAAAESRLTRLSQARESGGRHVAIERVQAAQDAVDKARRDSAPSTAREGNHTSWEQQQQVKGIPQDHEVSAVFRGGKLVKETKGGEAEVGADSKPGDTVTHTHPTITDVPTISLSDADVRTAAMHDAAEIRAVNTWGTASLKMADGSNLDWRTVNEWNGDAKAAAIDHEGTRAERLAKQEEVRLATAKKFGLKYEVVPHQQRQNEPTSSSSGEGNRPQGLRIRRNEQGDYTAETPDGTIHSGVHATKIDLEKELRDKGWLKSDVTPTQQKFLDALADPNVHLSYFGGRVRVALPNQPSFEVPKDTVTALRRKGHIEADRQGVRLKKR